MPNLLAHYGVQLLPGRLLVSGSDIRWLGLACLLPDLPWISQRLLWFAAPGIDRLQLRLYCMVLASLFCCLLLSLAVAVLTDQRRKVFLVLGGGSLLHLLLDAVQIKWANGVHLLAPFSWQLTQVGLFWPESIITLVLSGLGGAVFLALAWRDRNRSISWRLTGRTLACSAVLLLLWATAPLLFTGGPLQADNHYVKTLMEDTRRSGKAVAFDRSRFDKESSTLTIFTGERLQATGKTPPDDTTVSVKGYFVDERRVVIESLHEHSPWRDYLSIAGLVLLAGAWLLPKAKRYRLNRSTAAPGANTDPVQPAADD